MFTKWITALLILLSLTTSSCSKSEQQSEAKASQKIITVSKKPLSEMLFFSGTIKPVQITKIVSPQDGTIRDIHFVYGQSVNKDQLLLTIHSKKLQDEFQQALSKFLTSKEEMLNSTVNFEGAELLYQSDIISKQEYLNEKSRFENNKLSFIEAKFKFEEIMDEIPGLDAKDIEELRLADVKKFQQLYTEHISALPVKSTASGIVLFPDKEDDDKQSKIIIGTQVTKDQSLLSIGNVDGIEINFTVDQRDINKIHHGQSVTVSNEVFGNQTLVGTVESAAVQSTSKEDADKAEFPVQVVVKTLDKNLAKQLRIGMKVKVQVSISGPSTILIPINAVNIHDDKAKVTVITASGEQEQRSVTTGKTLMNEVQILQGLSEGDKIVVSD